MPRISLSCAFLVLGPGIAGADGYAHAPFRDDPVGLAQAAALERIALAAQVAAVAGPSGATEDDEREEDETEGPPHDLSLIRATLAATAPEVAQALVAAFGGGGPPAGPDLTVLVEQTRAAMPLPRAPGHRAALMAQLLLEEGGVAESYEKAAEGDGGAYLTGWFALGRVKALWDGLAPQAAPAQAADVQAMLAMLDRLYPGQDRPARLSPNPEDAESIAQQTVGLLEQATDADLYPGRDPGAAAGLVHRIASEGCARLDADPERGAEDLAVAAAYHAAIVQDTLSLLAPGRAAAVAAGFETGDCGPLLDALSAGQQALSP